MPRLLIGVAIVVGRIRHVVSQIEFGEVFAERQHAVVFVGKQVVALVVGHRAKHAQQRHFQTGMSLVTALLLPLPQITRIHVVNGLLDVAVAHAAFEISQRLVVNVGVVAKNPNRHHRIHAATNPSSPTCKWNRCPCAVEKLMIHRIPEIDHPILKPRHVRRRPVRVAAHDFPGAGELVAVNLQQIECWDRRTGSCKMVAHWFRMLIAALA